MNGHNKHRIVALVGPSLEHKHTCATLIKHGLNVVGICEADQRTAGLPLSYILKSIKRKGLWDTCSKVVARLLYLLLNRGQDREMFVRLFDEQEINEVLGRWDGQTHRTANYSSPETIKWLEELQPDILVAHTPYWIGKKIRSMPSTNIVLGGHPGITPNYRGSHSAFWALYKGKPEDVGCTVFVLNDGVDSGDIVAQERITVEVGDSFFTLCWKGMIRLAEMQAKIIRDCDAGVQIPRQPVSPRENTLFDNPSLREYIQYRYRQRLVR